MKDGGKINELCENLCISRETFKKDVDYINEKFRPLAICLKGNNVRLNYPKDYKKQQVYKLVLNNSLEVQIVEYIIFNRKVTIDKLTTVFLKSQSTIRRILKRIMMAINEYGLTINQKTLEIKGEELTKWSLVIDLVVEKYKNSNAFIKAYDISVSDHFIFNYIPIDLKTTCNLDFQQMELWRLFILIRYVIKRNEAEERLLRCDKSFIDTETKDFMEKLTNSSYAFNEYTLVSIVNQDRRVRQHQEKMKQLLNECAYQFNLPQHNQQKLLLKLYNVSLFYKSYIYFAYDWFKVYLENINEQHADYVLFMEERLQHYFHENDISSRECVVYTCIIYIYWGNLQIYLEQKRSNFRIALFFDTDIYHSLLIESEIQKQLGKRVSIDIISLEENSWTKEMFDITITNNAALKVEQGVKLVWSLFPTGQDIENLHHLYQHYLTGKEIY